MQDAAVTKPHQYIRDRFPKSLAICECKKVSRGHAFGNVGKRAVIQTARLLKHRPGDRDIVILGEPANRTHRRVVDRRQPARQFHPGLGPDAFDQTEEDIVE